VFGADVPMRRAARPRTERLEKPLGGERWRYDRPPDAQGGKRAKYPIDALTGVLLGHNIAVAELSAPSTEPMAMWV
jgi:hypothetical protein